MFTLYDGRNELYQWDLDRKVIVDDPTITEVHFCNRTDECSLVVKTYTENGTLYANIPNIILQSYYDIRVYAYCSNYTKVEETFKVKARTKPSDYIYTETELLTVKDVEKRMDELEVSFNDKIDETVSDYLNEHPVKVDLTGYAKEEYVDNAIDSIVFPEPDLKPYATRDWVDKQLDLYTDDLATTTYVDNAIENIEIPDIDLTGYATKDYVNKQGFIKEIPSQYVTETELSSKGYAKQQDLSIYARKSEIPTVPTKVSELLNDKGYINQHQSLAGYATTVYVDRAIEGIEFPEMPELDDYYTKEQTYSKAEVNNKLKDYTTTAYVDESIGKIEVPSLAGYATEEYVDTSINNLDVPSLATKGYVDLAIENIDFPETDLTDYATKEYVNTKVSNKQDHYVFDVNYYQASDEDIPVTAAMKEFCTRYMAGEPVTASLRDTYLDMNYTYPAVLKYTEAYNTKGVRLIDNHIDYDTTENYNIGFVLTIGKVEGTSTDTWISTFKQEELKPLATKEYVDKQIASGGSGGGSADLTNYYTKAEVDALIPDDYITSIPAEYVTDTELTNKGYQTADQVNALINTALGVIENGTY